MPAISQPGTTTGSQSAGTALQRSSRFLFLIHSLSQARSSTRPWSTTSGSTNHGRRKNLGDFLPAESCPIHRLTGTNRQHSEKYSPLELSSRTDSTSNPPGAASSLRHRELLRTRGAVQPSSVYLFERRWKSTATSRQNIVDTRSPTREKYHLG
mgnify:CR=1 FL=1